MKRAVRGVMVVLAAATVVGCGGRKLGASKAGAAAALHEVGQASSPSGSSNQALIAKVSACGGGTVQGEKGGTATVELSGCDTLTDSDKISFSANVTFDDYSEDGKNRYNGSMKVTFTLSGLSSPNASDLSASISYKGRVDISGEIEDFLEADITESIGFAQLTAESGDVTVTMNGTLKTSTATYTYSNEQLTFKTGELPAEDDA